MSQITQAPPSVKAVLNYVDPRRPGETIYAVKDRPEDDRVAYAPHETLIRNARLEEGLGLKTSGFTLARHRTQVSDFFDPAQTDGLYRREMEELVRSATGADKVIVFHMQARDYGPSATPGIRRPAYVAHIDYNEDTFRLRAREEMGDEADYWLQQDFAAINVWRGVHAVEEVPLTVCDARTVKQDALYEAPINERADQPTPYVGIQLSYDPDQRWFYYPNMQPDEALLFKLCDTDTARPRWCGHGAFDDPTSPPDARARVSFEVRTIAFFRKK